MAKVSAAELELRISTVIQLLTQGASSAAIKKYCLEKFKAPPRTVERWIAQADEEVVKISQPKKESRVAIALARYNDLIAKAYKRQDYREVRAIQAEINRMFGDNAPEKTDNKLTVSVEITPKDVELFTEMFNKKYR